MNRTARMMLLGGGKDKEKERRRRMGVTYEDWTPQNHWGPYMPPYYDGGEMEPESAFYDRRGRRHYDNGRYAPMSAYEEPESGGYDEYDGEPESRRYRRYSDGRFAPRSEYDRDRYTSYRPARDWDNMGSPRMIGFAREWNSKERRSDATMPMYREMDRMTGRRSERGMASGSETPKFNRRMAEEWTEGMRNADGTQGPHWSREKVKEIIEQYKVDCEFDEFYAVLNSIYSDYCEVLKKNNASKMDVYVDLAKAWLDDEDARKDKAAAYFYYVVEH